MIDIADLPDLKPTHERWWNEIGSAMRPLENEDTEQPSLFPKKPKK